MRNDVETVLAKARAVSARTAKSRLTQIETSEVSIVDRPANERGWAIKKRADREAAALNSLAFRVLLKEQIDLTKRENEQAVAKALSGGWR